MNKKIKDIKLELCMLQSLIGEENVEEKFIQLITEYPQCLKAIPILLAVEENEMYYYDEDKKDFIIYKFDEMNRTPEEYAAFIKTTGLFNILQQGNINDLVTYAMGVEIGMLFADEAEA